METRHAADLKKILEMIEADKKEMAQKMQAMRMMRSIGSESCGFHTPFLAAHFPFG
ncbi:hypothetical protein Tco_0284122, partial [Tanacetum coccineum]